MSSSAVVCPSCRVRAAISSFRISRQQWEIRSRGLASAMQQRKKPNRMILSKDVLRDESDVKRKPRTNDGPFRGMNRTDPGPLRDRAASRRQTTSTLGTRQQLSRRKEVVTQQKLQAGKDGREGGSTKGRTLRVKEKDDRPLFHALKMQQTLTPHLSYTQKDKLREKLDQVEAFEQLGLSPALVEAVYSQALPNLTTYSPSPVQKLAIPILVEKNKQYKKPKSITDPPNFDQFLLAAETGSGKTLAYLLPVIDGVKLQEVVDKQQTIAQQEELEKAKAEKARHDMFEADPSEDLSPTNPDMGRPRALILLPSSELVSQVGRVVKLISHAMKYRSAPISAANSPTVIRNRLFNPSGIDILISTPHLISSIAEKDPNILNRIQYLVVDEADSLLDRSFSPITCGIIDRAAPSLKQLILSSATIPRSLDTFLDKRFPQIKRLVTPKLHTISRRVQLGVVDIEKDPYRGRREYACADVIWQLGKSLHDDTSTDHHTMKSILVFVNERDQAQELADFLSSKGIDCSALTRDTTEQRQTEVLSAFTSPVPVVGETKDSSPQIPKSPLRSSNSSKFIPFENMPSDLDLSTSSTTTKSSRKLANTKVLVTTDLGSRGIDTLAVRHVILYDVPHTTIDFVHRLGRAGRFNRRGRGIVLVGKHDRKDVVREVRDAMFKGQALI